MFNVMDVQNTPPVFKTGSLTGIVNEDDPVGTAVVTVTAMDGDSGNPRRVIYDLLENPNDYFVIDQNSGEIRVDRALDRESLGPSSGILRLKVIKNISVQLSRVGFHLFGHQLFIPVLTYATDNHEYSPFTWQILPVPEFLYHLSHYFSGEKPI